VINDYMKYSEKYDKVLKELMGVSKEYIDSLNAEKIFSQLQAGCGLFTEKLNTKH